MKNPTAPRRPSDVRERILKEAVRLFAKNGFEGTSVQTVADAVGIKVPSLFYHFASKEQLLDAVIDDMLQHWSNELPILVSISKPGRDRFDTLIETLVGFFAEDRSRAIFSVRELISRPKFIADRLRERLGPWIQIISDYISMGKKSGIFRQEIDPEQYVFEVIMLVVGTVTLVDSAATIFEKQNTDPGLGFTDTIVKVARERLFTK